MGSRGGKQQVSVVLSTWAEGEKRHGDGVHAHHDLGNDQHGLSMHAGLGS